MLTETLAWRAVLALDRLIAERGLGPGRFAVTSEGARAVSPDQASEPAGAPETVWVSPPSDPDARAWRCAGPVDADAERVLDLYLPMVLAPVGSRPQVFAHLAQSLDGRIATAGGTSQWISGPIDQVHNHRMRALCDAVLVGAETVIHDDPQLTCREVEGSHPVRVVVDPRRRVDLDRRIFTDDAAPTLIISSRPADAAGDPGAGAPAPADAPALPAHVARIELGDPGEGLSPRAILAALQARDVRRVFVEGGGVTVSAFLRDGLLDRLQLTVAPMLIGSGRSSITLPNIESLADALRPRVRRFAFGPDVMFECVFDDRRDPLPGA